VSPPGEADFAALALSDRAVRFVTDRGGSVVEDALLAHVYGGTIPSALRSSMAAPLLADGRLERHADGRWRMRQASSLSNAEREFTALAIVASGPTPGRARLVRISALHVKSDTVVQRFDALLNPERHVPRYVAERAGVEREVLDGQPAFDAVLDALQVFVDERPILAQDVRLTWAFVEAEARRHGRALLEPTLLDVNELAAALLDLTGKPTLAAVAAALGIGTVHIADSGEEARVLGLVGCRLLALGAPRAAGAGGATTLRRGATARALPDEPGVYVLRDSQQRPLYVGKARRLRERMAAYVHRPLGPTRRLEGLVSSVETVDTTRCATDLEALVLEDREIRRLQPRFNTVRHSRAPRYWIRQPFVRQAARGRRLAPPRLELSAGPGTAEGEFVGPFRNEMLADQARGLAREVFQLDRLRLGGSPAYQERLQQAWQFLRGDSDRAEALAGRMSATLLRKVVAFDVRALLLPADPRLARYAVVRRGPTGVEGFLLDRAVLYGWARLEDDDTFAFARGLLDASMARTEAEDADVVLRWFGAQRPPAHLVCLPDDALAATDVIVAAAAACLLVREA
jgi:DNA polymerase III epsilon subunit-like protein